MSDNFAFSQGTGSTGAADNIDDVLYPRVKVTIGANNTNDGDVCTANPMPVSLPAAQVSTLTPPAAITGFATAAKQDTLDASINTLLKPASTLAAVTAITNVVHVDDNSGTLTVDGTVTANLSATDNAVLDSIQAGTDKIPALGQALAAASVPVVLTSAQQTALTPPAAITGFATETTLGGIKTGTDKIPTQGQAAMAASLPVVLASNQTSIPVAATLTAETTKVIGTVNISSSQTVGLAAGTAGIGKLTANSGVDIGDVDVTSISAGTNAIGDVGIVPRTSGGTDIFRSLDIDETEEDVKTSAGQLFGYFFFNAAVTTHYIKFYNATAANTTVGSTTPVLTLPMPAGAAANISFPWGIVFSTAICVAATTGVADNDTGEPATNAVVINVFYK
jgi:hypothetical protein